MQELRKPVRRQCRQLTDGGKPVTVELRPPDQLVFRVKGSRKEYGIPLDVVYWIAVRNEAEGG